MISPNDPLALAVDRLRDALAGTGAGPPGGIGRALAQLEVAMRQHAALGGWPEDSVANLDRPLLPSPGVDRRHAELRQHLAGLLREVRSLRNEVLALDGSAIRERAGQLIEEVERFNREEIDLVQESVTTDIGAGD